MKFWKKRKYNKQRIKRGFSDADTWDFCDFLLNQFTAGIKRFKELNNGYPLGLTKEDWDAILNEIIYHFTIVKDGIQNKYTDKYFDSLKYTRYKDENGNYIVEFENTNKELYEQYKTEQERILKEVDYHYHQGFLLLEKYMRDLWW